MAAATLSPAPDGSKRRHRPLGACLLPIGPARPRPANGVGASGLPLSAAAAAPRRGRLQEAVGCRWAALVSPPWPRLSLPEAAMPQFQTWEEFSRAAEKLYLADPMKVSRWRDGPGAGVFSALAAPLACPGSNVRPRASPRPPSPPG